MSLATVRRGPHQCCHPGTVALSNEASVGNSPRSPGEIPKRRDAELATTEMIHAEAQRWGEMRGRAKLSADSAPLREPSSSPSHAPGHLGASPTFLTHTHRPVCGHQKSRQSFITDPRHRRNTGSGNPWHRRSLDPAPRKLETQRALGTQRNPSLLNSAFTAPSAFQFLPSLAFECSPPDAESKWGEWRLAFGLPAFLMHTPGACLRGSRVGALP